MKKGALSKLVHLFSRRDRNYDDNSSVISAHSTGSFRPYRRSITRNNNSQNVIGITLPPTPRSPPPQSDTLRGFRTFFGNHRKQYTIASKQKYRSSILNWFDKHHMNFIDYFCHANDVDNAAYRPSTFLYRYIDWTFTASFTGVFFTFLFIYCALCLIFGGLLLVAGNAEPNCIVASGEPFGATPNTKFSDAFALSWTTFTTVGYGMTYTTTAGDFKGTEPHACTWVVFLCVSEAFLGLLFAGMCAAILFGKVNRVQSHANILFCNAVCLQYEEMEDDYHGENIDSERSHHPGLIPLGSTTVGTTTSIPSSAILDSNSRFSIPMPDLNDEESQLRIDTNARPQSQAPPSPSQTPYSTFVDQFNGCPVLKFQVVNELCNREGGELVDCIMKVVGIKFKGPGDGSITHSQYVRVNLVDFEHPFLSRCWHGVHILDDTSPLLTDRAKQRIRENNGSWPSSWFDPDVIRSKLDFHDLVVTIAAISNVSAVTVHAYKRYKIGDVLIGYNFAPITFRDIDTGKLEVDLSMINDVREQSGIRGEDLSVRRTSSKEFGIGALQKMSTIRIKKSKSGDGLGSVSSGTSKHKRSSSNQGLTSGHTSPMGASISAIPPDKLIDPSIPMSPLEVDIDSVASPNEATIVQSNLRDDIVQPNLEEDVNGVGVENNETKED